MHEESSGWFDGLRQGLIGTFVVAALFAAVFFTSKQTRVVSVDDGADHSLHPFSVTDTVFEVAAFRPTQSANRVWRVHVEQKRIESVDQKSDGRFPSIPYRLTPGSLDGGASVLVDDTGLRIPLRARNGEPYEDPALVGSLDPETVVAVGRRGTRTRLLVITRAGVIREVADLPDQVRPLALFQDAFYGATFVPSESIEASPTGPSELFRMTLDGVTSTVAFESAQPITAFIGSTSSQVFAYALDDGHLVATNGQATWRGEGKPLGWLQDGRLVLSRDRALWMLSATLDHAEFILELPESPNRLFTPSSLPF